MTQIVFKNKFYICGSFSEVIKQLKELSAQYNTVKEFLSETQTKLKVESFISIRR